MTLSRLYTGMGKYGFSVLLVLVFITEKFFK